MSIQKEPDKSKRISAKQSVADVSTHYSFISLKPNTHRDRRSQIGSKQHQQSKANRYLQVVGKSNSNIKEQQQIQSFGVFQSFQQICSCVPERQKIQHRATRGIKNNHQDLSGILTHRQGKKQDKSSRITPINSLMDLLKE